MRPYAEEPGAEQFACPVLDWRRRGRPLRRPYGKMRKLGIPSTRDKIVQEVIRQILETIYESPYGAYFQETSQGFRPGRSPHDALQVIRDEWTGTNWFLEGDIAACFDSIDHHILVEIVRKKINDERFINLIWKLLRAGYLNLPEVRKNSLSGTPQGGLVSPILANIYLHELDEKITEIQIREEKGKAKARNPQYGRLLSRLQYRRKKGEKDTPEVRALVQEMRAIPSVMVNDPNFIRIKYQRYADDWLVGICGPRVLAERIKEEIAQFLQERLLLTLSQEKTQITHARTQEAHFLGTLISVGNPRTAKIATVRSQSGHLIKRRSTGKEVRLMAPIRQLLRKLNQRGFCTPLGKPLPKKGWTALDAPQIVELYSGINRGIQNDYRFANNFGRLGYLQHILHVSLVKTLAMKYRTSADKIYRRFGKEITMTTRREGKERTTTFYLNHDWKKRRDGFQTRHAPIDLVQWGLRMRTRTKLENACCICNATTQIEMHHVRHIRKTGGRKPTGFNAILVNLNRKQIPVCQPCHRKIHRGEYDQMRLADLAYNPYPSEKRRKRKT